MTSNAGRLRFFAKAIGETNPVYTDVDAAQAAGHRDLPVPPTFLFGIELDSPDPFGWLSGIGVDLRRVLHGEQSFTYHSPAYAGDVLTAGTADQRRLRQEGRRAGVHRQEAPQSTRENGDAGRRAAP